MPRVALFVTCIVDQVLPEIGRASVNVLERVGCTVEFRAGQTCCGQATFNDGFHAEARVLARRTLDVLADTDAVVVPSGSCAAMIREFYPHLFEHEPVLAERARSLAHRTYELSEYLVRVLGVTDVGAALPATVAYHASCHGLRGLGLRDEPRRLLEAVRGLRLVDLIGVEECCGFGGFFSVKFSGLSGAMLAAKIESLEAASADVVTATDASCLMHIAGGLARRGSRIRAMHLAEVLAAT